jgi:hypothetical protein
MQNYLKQFEFIRFFVTTQQKYINLTPSQITFWEGFFQKSFTLIRRTIN